MIAVAMLNLGTSMRSSAAPSTPAETRAHFFSGRVLSYTFAMVDTFRSVVRAPRLLKTALFSTALVVLAACGGDGSDATVDTVPPASITPTTIATTTTTTPISTTTTTEPDFEGTPEFDSNSSVSTVGIDAVTFGMTLARAENSIAGSFVPVDDVNQECYQVRPSGGPNGVLLTVTAGTIERVDVTNPDITTRSGAGVGMSEEGLFSLFGDNLSTEASNTGGNRIVFTPSDASDAEFRVIFETDGSVVTSFRSGRLPQVESTLPCS